MSAPAPALARMPSAKVIVRLAEPAAAVAYFSVAFAAATLFSPVSFPAFLVRSWQQGQLMPVIIALTLLVDAALYLRVAHLLSVRPRLLVAACLGCLPVFIVLGLSVPFENSVSHMLAGDYSNASARIAEEILAHAYFTTVAAIFLPFLLIRLVQQFDSEGGTH